MPKTVVVTTCSANHLAQAKGLGDSLLNYNPAYVFLIGLVDKLQGRVAAGYYSPHQLLEAEDLAIPQWEQMRKQYSMFELNCALKIFFVQAAFDRLGADKVIFLDSDILVFHSLAYIEEQLDKNSPLSRQENLRCKPDRGPHHRSTTQRF